MAYWQPFGAQTIARVAALEAAQAATEAELDANYRLDIETGSPLAPVTVPTAALALYPLPAISAAPKTWRPEFWTLTSGVVIGSNDLSGVYEVAITLSFSDNAGSPTVWTWTIARGTDLATSPVIAERISAPNQLSIVGEPDGVTLHGEFSMPASGSAFEIGLFAAHDKGVSVDATIQSLGFTMHKVGTLDQV